MKRILYTKLWGDHITEAMSASFMALLFALFTLVGFLVGLPNTASVLLAASCTVASAGYLVTAYGYLRRREWAPRVGLAVSIVHFLGFVFIGGLWAALWLPGLSAATYAVDLFRRRE